MKVILTGATGMVGEGVLIECLNNPLVKEVLMINRKTLDRSHPKLKELIVPDFLHIDEYKEQLKGYDACFFCAGISSVGMSEADYTRITYDTTLAVARALLDVNPQLVFNFISGGHTDSSEKGKVMWARVKGKTENALHALPFKAQYNFRPALMKPFPEQRNLKGYNKYIRLLYPLFSLFFPGCTLHELGAAMIHAVSKGYDKPVLEVADIKKLALACTKV